MFLARAGVRKLTLYDKTVVKPGVLARQIFDRHQVGYGKAHATRTNVRYIDPRIEVVPLQKDIVGLLGDVELGQELLDADVVINATASVRVAAALEQRLRGWPRSHPPSFRWRSATGPTPD